MRGTMMDFPLTLPTLLERAESFFLASKSSLAAPTVPSSARATAISIAGRASSLRLSRNSVYAPAIVSPP